MVTIESRTWHSLDVAICVLHGISFIAALCVFYVRMRQHQRLVAHYSVPLAIYHLSQLVHFSAFSVIMDNAPMAACFTRRFVALYSTRSMQFFGAGFALRVWLAVSRQETGVLLTSDNWRRLDRWTAWISFLVPFIPAVIGVTPQIFMLDRLRTTSMFDCKYGYSARWQLLASDSAWAIPPTVMCIGLICACVVRTLARWDGMRRFVGHRTMPPSMMIRLSGVALNIGVIGVFHMYFNFHEYFTSTGGPMSPAGPNMLGWTLSQRNAERFGHILGDLTTSVIGILDFLAFGVDYSSLRMIGGRRCRQAANTFREKFGAAPTPKPTITPPAIMTEKSVALARPIGSSGDSNRPPAPVQHRPTLPPGKHAPLPLPEPVLVAEPVDFVDTDDSNSCYYECPSFEYQLPPPPPVRVYNPIVRHSSLPTLHALRASIDAVVTASTNSDTDLRPDAYHPSEVMSSVVVVPRRQAYRTPQPSPPLHSTRSQRKVSLAAVGGIPPSH